MNKIALVGDVHTGKTTWMENALLFLTSRGYSVGGVLQPVLLDNGLRVGYGLHVLSKNVVLPLAHKRINEHGYDFVENIWLESETEILRAEKEDKILLVDEVGKLESKGLGHGRVLGKLHKPLRCCAIWACQQGVLPEIEARFGRFDCYLSPKDSVSTLINLINA